MEQPASLLLILYLILCPHLLLVSHEALPTMATELREKHYATNICSDKGFFATKYVCRDNSFVVTKLRLSRLFPAAGRCKSV